MVPYNKDKTAWKQKRYLSRRGRIMAHKEEPNRFEGSYKFFLRVIVKERVKIDFEYFVLLMPGAKAIVHKW